MQMNSLLFLVVSDGREFRIYANGRVEGFGEPVKVVNYFPQLCSDLLQAELTRIGQDVCTELPHTHQDQQSIE